MSIRDSKGIVAWNIGLPVCNVVHIDATYLLKNFLVVYDRIPNSKNALLEAFFYR